MPHLAKVIFALVMFLPSVSFSETKETERLGRVTEQYGRCADVVLGNFDTDKKAQNAASLFYKAMIKNISSMIEIEKGQGHESTLIFIDIMGKDIFTGYLLRAFADVNEAYQKEKKSLQETNILTGSARINSFGASTGAMLFIKGCPNEGSDA